MRQVAPTVAALAVFLVASTVFAKETALRLPRGRRTYDETETFREALDPTRRMAVVDSEPSASRAGSAS